MVIDDGVDTGPRLKLIPGRPMSSIWTERWQDATDVTYERERRGHLPHQLRSTWKRWVEPGSSVLEAGCGLGHFTVAAHALGYRAEGVDWSEPTIARLRAQFPSIAWQVCDVRRLPFADRTFDSVYSPGVCEHFEDGPRAVLQETRRVLRVGGIAVVSSPCFNVWLQQRTSRLVSAEPPEDAGFHEYAFAPAGMTKPARTGRVCGAAGSSLCRARHACQIRRLARARWNEERVGAGRWTTSQSFAVGEARASGCARKR